jgi:aminoglycoside phosphotransferase (APT) family kinase protein
LIGQCPARDDLAMPIAQQRDPAAFQAAMQAWLAARLPGAEQLSVDGVETPKAVGNSNETILFSAAWREAGAARSGAFVARIAPQGFQVMLEPHFLEAMAVQRALAGSGLVPTPKVLWSEADPAVMGAPFFVMERLHGRVPTDNPSYNDPQSWVGQLAPAERGRLWRSAFEAFCGLHRRDLADVLDLPLKRPPPGSSGLEQELEYTDRFAVWAGDGLLHPVTIAARDWLRAQLPAERPTGFAWGDPRIENMMFGEDLSCIAVLDWELANLAGPLSDLGWWLFMDRQASFTGACHPRLAGLGSREETLALWRELTGRPSEGVDWYEVYAGYRNIACTTRFVNLYRDAGRPLPPSLSAQDNSSLRTVADILGLPPPNAYEGLVKAN